MSTAPNPAPDSAAKSAATKVLVCLPFASTEERITIAKNLREALPSYAVTLASPGLNPNEPLAPNIASIDFPDTDQRESSWILTAADCLTAAQLTVLHDVVVTLILGLEATSLSLDAIRSLVEAVAVNGTDFAAPCYTTGPHDALVSAAFLSPITAAIFGVKAFLPLPADAAISLRMAQRLAIVARRSSQPQADPLLWPASEAALASLTVAEVPCGTRTLPAPNNTDLNSLLTEILGSLFLDIETKASFWQRARPATPAIPLPELSLLPASPEDEEEIRRLVEDFHTAYINLQDIWALVLPPQSLLRVKRISNTAADAFLFPPDLWARTVYDFVLAFHLRTINRSHLLGALTPLYLAWVASHLHQSAGDPTRAAAHVQHTTAAFVQEKPYIVARWRWPDRFNP